VLYKAPRWRASDSFPRIL